jgi:hypothetical protein
MIFQKAYSVEVAIKLLYLLLIVWAMEVAFFLSRPMCCGRPPLDGVALYSFMTIVLMIGGFFLFLSKLISKGRNWSRLVYAVFVILALAAEFFIWKPHFSDSLFANILMILQYSLQISALALLFSPQSNEWFADQ